MEKHAYDETAHEALRLGIRDSLGFGVTSALTGYLDLGAGVLILWYGGILVLDDENHMTIGKLITFQLYWNMMNSSYQALQGLFTSFTRSAAAAEKVFNLMDSRGLFLKDVHPHPLFLNRNVHLHWCDVCSTRIRDGHAWRCKLCDFDMCSKCAGRKDRGTVGKSAHQQPYVIP